MNTSDWLTAKEVVAEFTLSRTTLSRLRHDGKIQTFGEGHKLTFRRKDIEEYLHGAPPTMIATSITREIVGCACGARMVVNPKSRTALHRRPLHDTDLLIRKHECPECGSSVYVADHVEKDNTGC
jgi:hypothetical protein